MPPLFEVMRETNPVRTPVTPVPVPIRSRPNSAPVPMPRSTNGAAGQTTPPLTLRTEDPAPAPEPASPSAGAAPRPEASRGSGGGRGWDLNRTVVLPVKTLLFAAGGVMALIVVVWAVAWQLAAQSERKQWAPDPDPTQVAPNTVLPTQDPLAAAERTAATPHQSQPSSTQPGTTRAAQQPPAASSTQPPKQAPAAPVTDPRGTGLNYLLVEGVVNYADAEAIVAFLEANGLPAVAIPKGKAEIAAAKAAGQKHWEVVLLEGIPGNQYSAKAARRAELIKRVQELGERLGREGLSNYRLASPIWKKY